MADETLIENTLGINGMRVVKIMCMGHPVNVDNWTYFIPGECADFFMVRDHDEDLDLHYLIMTWHGRGDVISVRGKPAVIWWINEAYTGIQFNADLAAATYFYKLKAWPEQILINKLPKNAVGSILSEFRGETGEVLLNELPNLPPRFLIAI